MEGDPQNQINSLISKLNHKGGLRPCTSCGEGDRLISSDLVRLGKNDFLRLSCVKCGLVSLHSIAILEK